MLQFGLAIGVGVEDAVIHDPKLIEVRVVVQAVDDANAGDNVVFGKYVIVFCDFSQTILGVSLSLFR